MLIFLLEKFMISFRIKFLKEDFKKYGGLILGKIFILSTKLLKINIIILIKLKLILVKLLEKMDELLPKKKFLK